MNLGDILSGLADMAAENELLLLAILLAVGTAIGSVKVKGFALGPAAVLFTALAFSAWDERLKLPAAIGVFGLAVFAYVVGVGAGPSFLGAIRTGGRVLVALVLTLVGAAAVTLLVGRALGLSSDLLAGAYAGALTNTPALAAATEQLQSEAPTVGYSVTYLFGVLGMLAATAIGLKLRAPHHALVEPIDEAPPDLARETVRIDRPDLPDLGELSERYELAFGRIMRGDAPGHPGVVDVATDDTRPQPGDILTVVGDPEAVARFTADHGHPSTVPLTLDRSTLDYQKITVSNSALTGQTLGELKLYRRFGATATRVGRGDVELLATDDLALVPGDRVRIVAPRDRMDGVRALLGDSERAAASFNPLGLTVGLLIGVLVGMLEFPLPGGTTFELGMAGGPLLAGLLLGMAQRTGPIVWAIPYGASSALSGVGVLLFLAYAGSNSGAALADAIVTPTGPLLLLLGAIVTTVTAATLILTGRYLTGVTGPRLAGTLAAAQTQPAVLAYANDRTDHDPRVNLGYALAYPVAMIVKVILAPLIGRL